MPTPERALALAYVWQYLLEWLSLLGIVAPPFGAVMTVALVFMANISQQRELTRYAAAPLPHGQQAVFAP